MNEAGASYIFDLTVPAEQAEKLMTKSDQSFGLACILSICFMPAFITVVMWRLKSAMFPKS
jgi:hypothetical protein